MSWMWNCEITWGCLFPSRRRSSRQISPSSHWGWHLHRSQPHSGWRHSSVHWYRTSPAQLCVSGWCWVRRSYGSPQSQSTNLNPCRKSQLDFCGREERETMAIWWICRIEAFEQLSLVLVGFLVSSGIAGAGFDARWCGTVVTIDTVIQKVWIVHPIGELKLGGCGEPGICPNPTTLTRRWS